MPTRSEDSLTPLPQMLIDGRARSDTEQTTVVSTAYQRQKLIKGKSELSFKPFKMVLTKLNEREETLTTNQMMLQCIKLYSLSRLV